MVTFLPDADWSLLDHVGIERELADLLGRGVDLVTRRSIEASRNGLRREAILTGAVEVYAAR
jgi:predicted nucleotidyltransferase